MLPPVASASIRVGFQMLRVNPMRTVLSTLGVIMGVASLVAVLALGDGMERYARDQVVRTTSLHAVSLATRAGRTVDGVFIPDSVVPVVTVADARAVAALPGVKEVALTVNGPALVTPDGPAAAAPRATYVTGAVASPSMTKQLTFAGGRFFTDAEVRESARVVVLNDRVARTVAGSAPPASLVGRTVRLQGKPFAVVGVLAAGEGGGGGEPMAYVPFGVAAEAMAPWPRPRPANLIAMAATVEDILPVKRQLEAYVARAHPEWRGRFTVQTDENRARQVGQGILVFKLLMGAITGISLLVGGIGIMNVLLASVAERTREIGIRKATGARRRDILVQFLSESVAITSAGGALGFALGLSGALGITAIMRSTTRAQIHAGFSWGTLLVAALAAIVVGLAFGTYPALRASRLSPVEAMHHE